MDGRVDDPANRRAELRSFGLLMGALLGLCFGLLIPWIWGLAWPLWPWLAGGLFALVGLAAPRLLGPLYRLWMRLGHALGWVNSRLVLGLVFYLMFVPVGLVMRLFRDPLARRAEPDAPSYRVPSRQPRKDNLERPF